MPVFWPVLGMDSSIFFFLKGVGREKEGKEGF